MMNHRGKETPVDSDGVDDEGLLQRWQSPTAIHYWLTSSDALGC